MTDRIEIVVNESFQSLIPAYLSGRRDEVGMIEDALDYEDFETIQRICYWSVLASALYGFDKFSSAIGAVEKAAEERNAVAIRATLSLLCDYLSNVSVRYV